MNRRVVITGLGAVTPLGLNMAESWAAVRAGRCGIGPITHYDTTGRTVTLAAEVKGLDADALLGKVEAKRMDRYCHFAVAAAREALEHAGITKENIDPERCGVTISSGIGGFSTTEAAKERGMEKGYDKVSPFMIPSIISNMAAGRVAIMAGFQGMCTCPVTACAGGTNAVGDAFHHIRDGYA
ncbi:MAG: beta-ketoacyl-[Oscillibacter sp.]|nr:beta-ketoacyl-[acyl-carrier-protein] synthase II [Oscillibacter sp.]